MNHRSDWPVGVNGFVGIVSCIIGLGVIYFGYGIGTESPKKDAAAEPVSAARPDRRRPVRAMNMALGNMVYFAQDLGFRVKSAKGDAVDGAKIAVRVENQLQRIRELYRQEIANNSALAGSLTLAFNVGPSGDVSQVREISSRLHDGEFTSAVAAEVSKWSFADIVGENLSVTCPLLFVHEGMDITTLIHWEKALGEPADQPALIRRVEKAVHNSAPTGAKSIAAPPAKPAGKAFRVKHAASLRREPKFSAASLAALTIGTEVTMLGKQGDWLKVRSADNGPSGFIRKEFVVPVEVASQ